MPKTIGILFVASEADPFIKTGSIGDIAGSIPKTLKTMGYDVRVMLPGYGSISPRRFQIHNLLRMQDVEIPVATDRLHASYLTNQNQKVLVYFIENEQYFNRDGLYYDPVTKKYFSDNDERFIFFCRGVLETLKRLAWQPQIIHCNDWQCGLIPAYLKSIYRTDPYFRNIKTVFTAFEKTGLPDGFLKTNGSNGDRLNFLKTGLAFADTITTFGNRAEKGLLTSPPGDLQEILRSRHNSIIAMGNGNGHADIAQQLSNIYSDLLKSN
jgi:starch synthase